MDVIKDFLAIIGMGGWYRYTFGVNGCSVDGPYKKRAWAIGPLEGARLGLVAITIKYHLRKRH